MHTMLRRALLFAPLAAFFSGEAAAQESLRNSLEYDVINRQRQSNIEKQYYNVRLGPVRFTANAGLTTTYNDNINVSEDAAQDDFIIRPSIGIGAMWQITEYNRLSLDADFGYTKYINHSEYDRPDISPGSTSDFSYDLLVGKVRFNFHDRFFYSQDPLQVSVVTDEADLGRFRNSIGLAMVVPMRDIDLTFGYDHVNYKFLNDNFANSSYAAEMFFARASYRINPTVILGVESSMGITDYERELRPDNRNYTAGPFVRWRASALIEIEARTGVSWYELSRLGTLGDVSAPLSYYASIEGTHQINSRVSHALQLGRDTQQGVELSANFTETMYVKYSTTWRVIQNVSLSGDLYYEYSESTGEYNLFGFSLFYNESFSRYGGGISLGYQLMENLNATLRYTHNIREGRRDYTQNSVVLALGYKF